MSVEELASACGAVVAIMRALMLIVDLFNLDDRVPKIKPVTDRVGTFLGGRKQRLSE